MKMSFLNKYFSSEAGANGSSGIEPKRSYNWLDAAIAEANANKKQAVESAGPIYGSSNNPETFPWENTPTFQSGPGLVHGHQFGTDLHRNFYLFGKNISSVVANGETNTQRIGFQDQTRYDSQVQSFGPATDYSTEKNSNKASGSFTLMGQTINIGEGSSMPLEQNRLNENSSILPTHQPLFAGNHNVEGNDQNDTLYANINGHFPAMPLNINNGGDVTVAYNALSVALNHNDGNDASLDLNHNITSENDVEQVNVAVADPAATSETDATGKKEKKKSKKNPSTNFPANVKSLLSTGILDGVPVKYTSWCRDKNCRGIIKGGGYKCGCHECKFSKVTNAYEFEIHAGCKTKHPNNHIYFENGKSVYEVVVELQTTPNDKLFEVIQNVTGSPINKKNFATWKESFEAASSELQRINAKDGVVIHS